jgi:pilus assembly protein CpaE
MVAGFAEAIDGLGIPVATVLLEDSLSNQLFIVAVISPNRTVHGEIDSALEGNPDIENLWSLSEYPEPAQLTEIRKATGGCVVFLDFADPIRARAIAAELDSGYPLAATVAVHWAKSPKDVLELMQLGIREVVSLPIVPSEVLRAFTQVIRKLRVPGNPEDEGGHLYAFLPAKPGVGATTLAVHCAAAAARLSNQRTLLLDFDFRLGMTSFLLKLNGNYSVLDAAASGERFDTEIWNSMVSRRGLLDILGSAPINFGGVNPEKGAIKLIDMARQSYQIACADLPGEMRDYEVETIRRAKECFLVCTPDIGVLHMAKRKAEMLRSLGLQPKVSVIMTRVEGRGAMATKDIEAILQLPVRFSVASADKQISEATQTGRVLEGRSPLVTQIENVARRMVPGTANKSESKGRRFIDMFSVSSVRDRARWGS